MHVGERARQRQPCAAELQKAQMGAMPGLTRKRSCQQKVSRGLVESKLTYARNAEKAALCDHVVVESLSPDH